MPQFLGFFFFFLTMSMNSIKNNAQHNVLLAIGQVYHARSYKHAVRAVAHAMCAPSRTLCARRRARYVRAVAHAMCAVTFTVGEVSIVVCPKISIILCLGRALLRHKPYVVIGEIPCSRFSVAVKNSLSQQKTLRSLPRQRNLYHDSKL